MEEAEVPMCQLVESGEDMSVVFDLADEALQLKSYSGLLLDCIRLGRSTKRLRLLTTVFWGCEEFPSLPHSAVTPSGKPFVVMNRLHSVHEEEASLLLGYPTKHFPTVSSDFLVIEAIPRCLAPHLI